MHKFPRSNPLRAGLAALLVLLVSLPAAVSTASTPAPGALNIEEQHVFVARLVRDYMLRRHYIKAPLDDRLSSEVLDHYLDSLDPERVYFLKQDIDKFNEIRYEFDDFIEQSRLEPAFAMFLVYRTRVRHQVDVALDWLEAGFDFDIDESYEVDRSEAPWAGSQEELDELWRKRVKNDLLALVISGKEEQEARDTLAKRYAQLKSRTDQLKTNDVFQFYINAYLSAVEPHTSYLSPRASENFRIRMSLSLEGIGAVLQSENEYTRVTRIVTGGPADLSGRLHAGDRIVGVGQGEDGGIEDVIGWRLDDVVDLIRGPKGSTVQLRILPDKAGNSGETTVIAIRRDKINLEEQAAKSSILEFDHQGRHHRFGVIDVPTFYADFDGRSQGDPQYRSTTKDVRKLIADLEQDGIDALIIDLRGNGGGALSEAISLTGLFIESGPIVQVRDTSGRIRVNVDPDPSISYTGPLAVIVDRNSASASEIFAGAIQDYNRGLVLGEPTFGKGTVQNLVSLGRHSRSEDDLGQLKLTVAQFFRVNGDSTQHRGVVPDILFPTARHAENQGERAFENALPWSRIPPTEYSTRYTIGNGDMLARLLRDFDARKDDSEGLRYLHDAETLSNSVREATEVSLNEGARRLQIEGREQQGTEIENRLRASRGLPAVDAGARNEQPEDEFAEREDADEFPPDILLEETGFVLADLIALLGDHSQIAHTGEGAARSRDN